MGLSDLLGGKNVCAISGEGVSESVIGEPSRKGGDFAT